MWTDKAQELRQRNKNPQGGTSDCIKKESSVTSGEPGSGRYPTRERRKPSHLKDFVTDNIDSDEIHTTIDYCYRAVCGVPHTFKEAMDSVKSKQWV